MTTSVAIKAKREATSRPQYKAPLAARQDNSTEGPSFGFVQDKGNDFTEKQLDTGFLDHAFDGTDAAEGSPTDSWEEGNLRVDITAVDRSMRLVLDASGSVRPIDAGYIGTNWIMRQGLIWADESERVLHYYPETMLAYNVSRLRAAWQDEIPKTADVVFLGSASTDDPGVPYVWAAVNSAAVPLTLVTCTYINDGGSKVFLVDDVGVGIMNLKLEKLRYTVTSGVVDDCFEYPWEAPAPP